MPTTDISFPQYRKLEGFGRFYKILDETTFEEVGLVNATLHRSTVHAIQYPERVRIQDMLHEAWQFRKMSEAEITTYFPE